MSIVRLLTIAALMTGVAAFNASAVEATADAASGAKVSKEERKAAAAKRKADVKEATAKGEMTKSGDASQDSAASAPAMSKEERKAAAAKRRAAMKEANKKGELPKTNEAGEMKK